MNETKKKNATLQNKAKHSIEKNEPNGGHSSVGGVSPLANRERGITLIALVITVIVLLILAGVAVSMALNEGNLFAKANEAKTSWNRKVEEENGINDTLAYIEQYVEGEGGGAGAGTPTPGGLPTGWSSTAVASAYPSVSDAQKAPIPVGYTVSGVTGENSIATGLVIYETGSANTTTEGFWTATDNGELVCQKTYNQYVWIPVADINDMVMCESRTASSECNIELVNGVLQCTNQAHSSTATDLCGRLYGGGTSFGTQAPATYTYNSGYREPAVVTNKSSATSLENYLDNQGTGNYDCDPANSILKEDGTTSVTGASNILTELKRQFNNMAKSVYTYGGFYVGRYEAGYVDNVVTSKKATPVANILNAGSYNSSTNLGGVGNWYGLYNKVIKSNTGTVSQMIWGCQWDQVMKFVNGKTDGNGDPYNVTTAKTTSGTTRHTGSKAATGANTNDLVQNIYDLEGNFYEWTSTAVNTRNRAYRGGYCNTSNATSSRYDNNPTYTYAYYSVRPGLYVSL